MAGCRGRVRGRTRWLAAPTTAVVLAGMAIVPAQAAAGSGHAHARPPAPGIHAARGVGVLSVPKPRIRNAAAARYRASATSWPSPAQADISLARTAQGHGAATPVWAQAAGQGKKAGLTAVAVRVLSHTAARAAGVPGVVFTAQPARGRPGGRVRLGVNYARFAQVSGGNYGLGLGLVELPACALTTPRRPACRKEHPLASVNDTAAHTVSADVTLPSSNSAAGALVLAAAPASDQGGGPAGTYSATTLKPSGTWAEAGSEGSFTYAYPMTVPPAASGLVPELSLNYDSSLVDGQTSATQTQASWVGDGWSTPESSIEQSFIPCSDNPEGSASPKSTQDECYNGPVLTLIQDATSIPLVCPVPFSYTTTSTCKASDDTGQVITHHVSSGNGSGTRFTDYWTITNRNGQTTYFGLNHLPGWASGDQATNSVQSMPVFSAHSGDPCYSSSGFGSSACTMAYRWDMDYATDSHGNAMAYYYKQATNAYAENGGTSTATSYIRDGYLDHIDYGFTDGNAYSGHAPDEVVFGTGDRCFSGTCDPLNSANAVNWPDVPYTQDNCAAGASCQVASPTFWSTVRLASVTTQQWNGSQYVPADTWTLSQHFPPTGDETSPSLWLDSISHTGNDTSAGGSAVTLPNLSFAGTDFGNRVNPGNYPALDRYRITQITTETGAVISVTYELTSPCNPSSYPSPSSNTSSCFPVYWQQFSPPTPDWFNKYALESVSVADPTGGAPSEYYSYSYSGAAWHFDDNEVVEPKFRTYGQWRGYQDVKTYSGTGADAQTENETTYYQGMNGDTLPGGGTRSVTLPDSQGGQHVDYNQLASYPLETTSYDFAGGPVENSTINSYWVSAAAADRARSGLPDLTANFVGPVETWARQAITDTGTTTWRKTETDTSYDATPSDADFGLPLYVFRHGDLSDASQQACTTTTYAPANASENLVGLPAEVETDAAACGGSNPNGASAPGSGQVNALTAPAGLSRPDDVISDTRTFYDNPTLAQTWPQPASPTWPQATPTKGEVSVVQAANGYASGAFTYLTDKTSVYDSYGRPTATYDANGSKTTTSYTMTNGVTTRETVTNPLNQASTTAYDPLREVPLTLTDPNNITTTLHYNGLGWLIDVWGYSRATTSPANHIYSYAVSSSAPTVVTSEQLNNESGYVTSTALFDALLRPRQTQAPTPQGGMLVSDNFYDSRGWQWKTNVKWWDSSASPGATIVTVPDSQVPDQQVADFDGMDRPVLVTSYDDSAVKSTTATAYYGDRVTTVPASGGTPTSTVTDALGRTTELDSYTGAPTVTTSTASNITTVTISGGTTQATAYGYNTRGELSTVTDAATGERWTKSYDLLGQQTGATSPSSGSTSMTYDNNGNLNSATDANGHTISYTYDALNRKTGEYDGPSTASPQLASWAYDNSNNVSGVTDPIGQLTTETSDAGGNAYTIQQKGFNAFGESLGETVTLPAAEGALTGSYSLTHTYSATTGLLLRDSYPASPGASALPAETVTHGYETGLDLPDGMGGNLAAYVQNVTYNAFSQVAQEEVGSTSNNAYITSTYDPHTLHLTDTQVQNTNVQPSAPYDDTSYAHDPYGNITAETDTRTTAGTGTQAETQCFSYDTLDRLTQAWTATDNCAADPANNGGSTVGDQISGGAYWTSWQFDPLGDWTTQTQHSLTGAQDTVTSYTYNGNGNGQPNTLTGTSVTGPSGTSTASYSYDADGNTTARNLPAGNQSLTWTHDGKLATDSSSALTTSYVYDADGNLMLQKDPGLTTLYLFGGAEQIYLNTATGAITGTRFLPLSGGGTVVRTGGGTSYSFEVSDSRGTSLLTLDNTAANPVWRQFTPYGAPRGQAPSSWPDTNGFLGKPTDADTGLTIVGARQYDPSTGRFASVDPVLNASEPQSLGGYAYAGDNPVTNSDPSGKMMIDTGSCVGSVQYCVAHTPSGGGSSSSSSSGNGGGGICYYCHYAPPRYTSGASSYAPSAYYAPSATSTSGWFPPEAPGFSSPAESITRAIFGHSATSAGSKLSCLGPVEPASCQTNQDLLGAQFNQNSGDPRWKKIGKQIIISAGFGIYYILMGGHHEPDPLTVDDPPETIDEQVEKGGQGETGDPGTSQGPEPGSESGGEEGGGGTTIIVTGGPGGWWPEGEPVGPPIHIDPPEQPPAEEPTGEENSSVINPPFLPGMIGDFGPGSGIETGWLLWGW